MVAAVEWQRVSVFFQYRNCLRYMTLKQPKRGNSSSELGLNKKAEEVQVATLLTVIGEEAREINKVLEKLE